MQTIGVVVGESFASVFTPIITGVTTGLNILISVIEMIPKPLKTFMASAFVAFSAMLLIVGAGYALAAAWGIAKIALIAFKAQLASMGVMVGWAAAGLLVVAGAFYAIKQGFDENLGGLADGIGVITGKVKLFFDAIQQLTSGDGKLRGGVLEGLLDPKNSGVMNMVKSFHQARFRINAFWKGFKDGAAKAYALAGPVFRNLKTALFGIMHALGFANEEWNAGIMVADEFNDTGRTMGSILSNVLLVGVELLTFGIQMLGPAIATVGLAFDVFKMAMFPVIWALTQIFKVVNWVIEVFHAFVGVSMEVGSAGNLVSSMLGVMLGMLIAYKVVMAASAAMSILWSAATTVAALASGALGVALLPVLGIIAGVAAAIAAAMLIWDLWTGKVGGLTDRLRGLNKHLYMTEEQLNKIGETGKRGLGHLKRGGFLTIDQQAKNAGITTDEYIDKHATKTAAPGVEGGETKEQIVKRMRASLKVQREQEKQDLQKAAQGKSKAGVDGRTNRQGQGPMTQDELQQGVFNALKDAGLGGKVKPPNFNINLDGQRLGQGVMDGQNEANALNWEADNSGTGT
jgi:hypothetical protein